MQARETTTTRRILGPVRPGAARPKLRDNYKAVPFFVAKTAPESKWSPLGSCYGGQPGEARKASPPGSVAAMAKRAREALGLSQAGLARAMGLPDAKRRTVSNLEGGYSTGYSGDARRILEYLGIQPPQEKPTRRDKGSPRNG